MNNTELEFAEAILHELEGARAARERGDYARAVEIYSSLRAECGQMMADEIADLRPPRGRPGFALTPGQGRVN